MEATSRVDRPWGYYFNLHEEREVKVKRLTVMDNKRISLQSHSGRDEYWFIVEGKGLMQIGETELGVYPGATIQVLRGETHRVQALGGQLVIIEVQVGTNDEEDIVRYEDDYGRA